VALSITGLRCLVGIADAGMNVSAAANALHLSQPSVSRQLAQIEQALGLRVFTRRGRNLVELTDDGTEVLALARRMLADYERLRQLARARRGHAADELVIAAPQGYTLHVLPPLLKRLREDFPELSVRLRCLGEGDGPRPAEHADCDLLLLSTAGDEASEPGSIPLFRWRRVAIVGRDHPLAQHRGPLSLGELARWPLVTYEAARRPGASFCRHLQAAGHRPRFACSAPDPQTLKAYTRAGLGVGVVSEFSVSAEDLEYLAVLPLDAGLPDCIAWALLPRGRPLGRPVLGLLHQLAPHIDLPALGRMAAGLLPWAGAVPPVLHGRRLS
jgi:DNA-binding transcriptional LysR family regulator